MTGFLTKQFRTGTGLTANVALCGPADSALVSVSVRSEVRPVVRASHSPLVVRVKVCVCGVLGK